MSNRLEEFIHKNKAAFDDQVPSAALWKRLEKKMQEAASSPGNIQQPSAAPVVKINWWKWTAAAMIIMTAGVLSRPYWKTGSTAPDGPALATQTEKRAETRPAEGTPANGALAYDSGNASRGNESGLRKDNPTQQAASGNDAVKEELFHYARLIEIKQKEMATLKNNDPELFEQFSDDLTALDNSYAVLKRKYDEGLNSEQLLSAMIENLKLQTELLNRQLEVTKKLKQQKNEANYKNI